MIPRLLTVWESVRSSLWALPLTMMLGACVLAYVALNAKIDIGDDPVWFLYSGTARQAPQFLSNLVTAMITMATLAISITMVVLTLAAQQLGPRLIRSFMGDWRTQAALGLFVATVVYLLLVLRSSYGDLDTVANLAVTVGAALVLVSVTTLLLFVHHLAQSIIADNVIERVGAQLDDDAERLLPEQEVEQAETPPDSESAPVWLAVGGYVRAIDFSSIVEAAREAGALVKLQLRPGQHAIPGSLLARVSPASAANGPLGKAIQSAVLIGRERTAFQDLEYSMHQLVEIALRALSPGINDPFTAVAVLDRLTLSMSKVMKRGAGRSVYQDEDNVTRLLITLTNFEGLTDTGFNQIRQVSSGKPDILIRMAENIGQLLRIANKTQRRALEKHLRLVINAGSRTIADESDRNDLKEAASTARRGKDGTATGKSVAV